ncbi:MAG: transcription termination factor NusA [Chloroflexota bacterium]|nr:transcription termination factor NusA [Chloroflexota bacterium]
MKNDFLSAIEQICNERSLSQDVVLEAVEKALLSAYRRDFGSVSNAEAQIDLQSGRASIFTEKQVVDKVEGEREQISLMEARQIDPEAEVGSKVLLEVTPDDFGRIATQTAKQVVLQRIREAERNALYETYTEREGEIVNGTVQRVSDGAITINLGRVQAILPRSEQIRSEHYKVGERISAYVLEVRKSTRGPQIIVSRAHSRMLRRLLELEVPEVFNGTVEIKGIAREAGARSKVAVWATQEGIDPVGACVGMHGVRIKSIVQALSGEKIDVVQWDPNEETFVANALSPAKVLRVDLHEDRERGGKTATVVVPDDQLSLAIGRGGQNARLAAKLTGWRVDIKGTSEAAREEVQRVGMRELKERAKGDLLSMAEELLRQHEGDLSLLESIQKLGRMAEEAELAEAETPIEELGLSTRVQNVLKRGEIDTIEKLLAIWREDPQELLDVRLFGPKSLEEVHQRLEEEGYLPLEEEAKAPPEEAEAAEVEKPAEAEVEEEPEEVEEVEEEEAPSGEGVPLADLILSPTTITLLKAAGIGDVADLVELMAEPDALLAVPGFTPRYAEEVEVQLQVFGYWSPDGEEA